jgi:hypothetical protein
VVVKEFATMRNLIRGLFAVMTLALLPLVSQASVAVGISVNFAPPPLPVYVQPAIPAPGYIWTPGYWAFGPAGYYWVPGVWVLPPAVGLLWTPGYWGWISGSYVWHAGYWGTHVGFYGGINYGCGYSGVGYAGGYWHGNHFLYNSSVNNVRNINVTNVYTRNVVNEVHVNRTSFNGGAGGILARPSPGELSAAHERHVGYTGPQLEQQHLARGNPSMRAVSNGGMPPEGSRPASFAGHDMHRAPMPVHAAPAGYAPAAAPHAYRPPPTYAQPGMAPAPARQAYPPAAAHGGYAGQGQHYAAREPQGRPDGIAHEGHGDGPGRR